jgi:uncharacterized protein YjdB
MAWSSSNTGVATVDQAGVVRAVADGTAAITVMSGDVTGTATVRVQRTAAALQIMAGDGQRATVVSALPVAPAVSVQDAGGSPLAGATVVFSVTAGSVASASSTTGEAGAASAGTWTLGPRAGPQRLSAQVQGTTLSVEFSATAVAGPAAAIDAVSGDGQSGAAGSTLPQQLVVRVTDVHGNAVSGAAVSFAASGGTITPASALTGETGQASAQWTLPNNAGAQAARASIETGASASFSAFVRAGAPAVILMHAGSGQTGTVGTTLPSVPIFRVADAFGNPVAGIAVEFAVTSGTLQFARAPSGEDGLVSPGAWTLGTRAGTHRLRAHVQSTPTLAAELTATATPGPAAAIEVVNGQGQTGPAGSTLPEPLVVRVTDVYGNAVSRAAVSFSASGGTITPASAQTGETGLASAAWTLPSGAGPHTAQASLATGASVSFGAVAQAGAPYVLAVHDGSEQTGTVGSTLPAQPRFRVADASGNPVAGVTVAFAVSGGAIQHESAVTGEDGIVSAGAWTLGTTPGQYTVTAAIGSLTVVARASAVAGSPAALTIVAGDGQTAAAGAAVSVPPTVLVSDEFGNAVAGTVVTFAVTSGGGSVAGATAVTDDAGRASAGSWTLGATPGSNTLTATAGSLAAVFSAEGTRLAAVLEKVQGDAQTGQVGTALPVHPAVRVTDAAGNPLNEQNVSFIVAEGSGSVSNAASVTNAEGIAHAGAWTLGPAPGPQTLHAVVGDLTVAFTAQAVPDTALPDLRLTGFTLAQSARLQLLPGDIELPAGVTLPLVAIGHGPVTFHSSDEAVAAITTAGVLTTTGAGTATITATLADMPTVSDRITVTVAGAPAPAEEVPAPFTGRLPDADGNAVAAAAAGAAPVQLMAGRVYHLGAAVTSFVAAAGPATTRLRVLDAETGATVTHYDQAHGPIAAGTSVTVTFEVRPAATWPATVELEIEVDALGEVQEADETNNVHLIPEPFDRVPELTLAVVPGAATLSGGATLTPAAIVSGSSNTSVSWRSVDHNVATVSAAGLITAGNAGHTIVFARAAADSMVAAGMLVTVNTPAVHVSIDPTSAQLVVGGTLQFAATVTNTTNTSVVWRSRNPSVATISPTGLLTAVAAGIAEVEVVAAADTLKRATAIITVVPPATIVLQLGEGRTFLGVSFTAPLAVGLTTPAPEGGITVDVAVSHPTRAGISNEGMVFIPAGSTGGTLTLTGLAAGSVTLTATAEGYTTGSLTVPVSLRLISLPSTLNVPFGGTASLPIQLAEPAPAGGTVVTLVSSDAERVSVATATVTVPAGAIAANATLNGVYPGPSTIQASAAEYIGASTAATTRANLDITQSSVSFSVGFPTTATVRFMSSGSAIAAPAGGVAVTVTSRNAACAAAPDVTINAGLTSQTIPIDYGGTATTPCTTWLVASAADIAPDSVQVTVNPPPAISIGSLTVGTGLQRTRSSSSLGYANHGGVTVTLVSADPSRVLVAADASTPGADTLRVWVSNGQSAIPFYIQAQDGVTGAVTVTASAPKFLSGSMTATVVTPGLDMYGLPSSTTTLSPRSPVYAQVGIPCTGGSSLCEVQSRRAGAAAIPVTFVLPDTTTTGRLVMSSDSGTSVVAYVQPQLYYSPTSVAAGGAAFQPLVAGTATITVTAPGFITLPAGTRSISIASPTISVSGTTVGSGLMRSRGSASLGASEHGGVVVRVTSADTALFLVSPNTSTGGRPFIDVHVANGQTNIPFQVHGLEGVTGSAAVMVTAPGFSNASATTTVVQAGVELHNVPGTTTSLTGNRVIYAQVGIPNSTHLYVQEIQNVRAGAAPLNITFATPDSSVVRLITARGTADTASAAINPGLYYTPTSTAAGVTMEPNMAGSTTISVSAPGVIATANATRAITVTTASISLSNTTVGAGLQRSRAGASLGASDHGGVTVTLVSSDSARILLSPNASTPGTGTLQVAVANGSTNIPFYAQGLENVTGTATISASAPGFNNATATFSVVQPALAVVNLPASTTTLSPQSPFYAQVGLANSSEQVVEVQSVRAGGTPIVVTFTSSSPAGQLVTSSTSGGTATVTIPVGLYYSPTNVTGGGVAFQPLTAGTTRVSGTATGILSGAAFRDVTVSAPAITMAGTTVGAGLMRSRGSAGLGASNHGGVTVRIRSSNGTVALVSPNASTAGTDSIEVFVPSGSTNIPFHVHGVDGAAGTVSITASAAGFTDGTATAAVVEPGVEVIGLATTLNLASNDDPGYVQVGVPCTNNTSVCEAQNRRAGQPALQATLTSSSPAVVSLVTATEVAGSVIVSINPGVYYSPTSVSAGGFAARASGVGTSTMTAAIPGFTPMNTATRSITVANASVNTAAATLGAGLQRQRPSGSLSGPNHGGVTVRITSSDPARLLVSPNATTAGTSFIDVFVPHGSTNLPYFVQGVEGATGSVAVTAEVPTWTSSTVTWAVVQPAVELQGMPTTATAGSAANPFYAQVGIPNSGFTAVQEVQNVRAGASPLTVTFTSSDGDVGQILANSVTASSGTAGIASGTYHTPTSIAGGGAAFVPIAAGTVNVTATAPGYRAVTISTRTVTVQ